MNKPGEKKYTLSVIVAVAENGAIGKENRLLWHISEDLKYFKRTTQGCPVIMGHKTWLSIGKPLPGRRNMVLSRSLIKSQEAIHEISNLEIHDNRHIIPGAELYASLEDALTDIHTSPYEIFIIGGGEVYRQALPLADKLYLTKVHLTVNDADTFFPEIDPAQWKEVFREFHQQGERFEHPFEFIVYERVRN
ncbi:MAG: hypothetical protein CVU12_00550 [Bacteroidetes bacterium HGW-Bacteroidetes-7]|jgi:dihydrofolate reductase|nr:MAG: hypothetical protein CVU12_00550 [Bacteroidetes bacterium HGW-Bacteroidetes-7]